MAKTTQQQRPGVPPEGPGGGAAADAGKAPPYGTARPADGGPVPRAVDGLDRAPPGLKRFKVRCANYADHYGLTQYVLAADRASAEAFHTESVGLDAHLADLKARNVTPEPVRLSVTELPD